MGRIPEKASCDICYHTADPDTIRGKWFSVVGPKNDGQGSIFSFDICSDKCMKALFHRMYGGTLNA